MIFRVAFISTDEIGKSSFKIEAKLFFRCQRWFEEDTTFLVIVELIDVLLGSSFIVTILRKNLSDLNISGLRG